MQGRREGSILLCACVSLRISVRIPPYPPGKWALFGFGAGSDCTLVSYLRTCCERLVLQQHTAILFQDVPDDHLRARPLPPLVGDGGVHLDGAKRPALYLCSS